MKKYEGCPFCQMSPPYDLGSGNEYILCDTHTKIWEGNVNAGYILDTDKFIEDLEKSKQENKGQL